MGRPRKSELRNRQLNVSLTEAELDNIRRRAEAVGMRVVPFGRAVLLDETGGVRRVVAKDGESAAERLIHTQLTSLGNNLNQLLRYLHRTGDPVPADLEPLLTDIRQILARRAQR